MTLGISPLLSLLITDDKYDYSLGLSMLLLDVKVEDYLSWAILTNDDFYCILYTATALLLTKWFESVFLCLG